MPISLRAFRPLATAFIILIFALPLRSQAASPENCHVGSYRMSDGRVIDIDYAGDGFLRWRTLSGETGRLVKNRDGSWSSTYGWTGRADGNTVVFADCGRGEMRFDKKSGRRIVFDVINTTFADNGTRLRGRLVMPKGNGKVPIVVLVHGSEHDSAVDTYELQRIFPAEGIGTFVYDKRGTGESGGSYTQDFNILATDAIAAMHEARRLARRRAGRIGYQGGSEGGWVVPLAANRAPVDFAIVSFGLAVSVVQEDQESVALDMSLHHHSASETAQALELARAGEHVVETHGAEGYENFDRLREKYKSGPWYKDVHGDFLFFILQLNKQQIAEATAKYLPGTPFRYDPMPTLRRSSTPQLWVLGADDLEAPSAETARRIKSLIARGKNFTLAVYPGAEHGMTLYERNAKGERVSTRYAPEYFQMMTDFIRNGRIDRKYGNAEITEPKP